MKFSLRKTSQQRSPRVRATIAGSVPGVIPGSVPGAIPGVLRGIVLGALLGLIATGTARADSPLADLLQAGRLDEAARLLDAGSDVNATQDDGSTPLLWAVYRRDVGLVDALLAAGADASLGNRYGSSPLAEAVKLGDAPLVERLLAAGADPDAPNADGQTALMLAARVGQLPLARLLLAAGADVNASEFWRGQTALMWAIDGDFADFATLLIESGADVGARAFANDWGAQITSEPRAQYRPTGGLTPLLYAARGGCLDCIRAIVAAGEPVDRPTPDGVTPLMLALDNTHYDAAALLLDLGANPHYSDWWGRTALYLAVDMNSYPSGVPARGPARDGQQPIGAMQIIERLIAAGVEINPQLNMHRVGRGGNSQRFTDDLLTAGATPLLRAAITHDHEVMRRLLAEGALVDLPNVMGVTPLMATAGLGVREPGFGSNRAPRFVDDPEIEGKVIESMRILLDAGADINARVNERFNRTSRIARPSSMSDREGQTALFSPAGRGWAHVVGFMLEQGADPAITDELGRKAVDAARGRLASGAPVYADVAELLDR